MLKHAIFMHSVRLQHVIIDFALSNLSFCKIILEQFNTTNPVSEEFKQITSL
jgi:hypothetical protein